MFYQMHGNLNYTLRVDNRTMHLGWINTTLHLDGQVLQGGAGRAEALNQALPKRPGGRVRDGVMSVYNYGKLRITQVLEVVPTRTSKNAPDQRRRLDSVVILQIVENKDDRPHRFGLRANMDMFWVDNDGAIFASPTTHPNKLLDGVVLKGKDLPDYLQVLQAPNLNNPGEVAHFTFNLGRSVEPPTRVILTRLGAWIDAWDMQAAPAQGDSAMGIYWDPQEIKPNGRRVLGYAYGRGIATNPENEARVEVALGGSFEPGKAFTVTAYVEDPAPGQSLALELPPGMELLEGAQVQPVPPATDDGDALVFWKARVQRLGEFPLRVRSSTGVTQTKVITITR
jgi:hypothetical protein